MERYHWLGLIVVRVLSLVLVWYLVSHWALLSIWGAVVLLNVAFDVLDILLFSKRKR
jgi:hypothetical protein